ncbi:MAG: UDP-N-acetylmuramoyl-tripeptide--D-alanyl-D-alanine ligase [Clostridia bacterium]|nr:UDP-N-acetylmuramoyl-tripeptide--D-alanyl-D-alanine ligase [Clostridia bacterium]
MEYIHFTGLILLCAGIMGGFVRCAHMLQQNSYKPERYLTFGKTASKGRSLFALLAGLALLGLGFLFQPAFAGVAGLFGYIRILKNAKEQSKAIKPLVFTARVKRQIATACVLLLILLGAWWLGSFGVYISFAGLLFFFGFTPVLMLLVLYLNAPMEKMISNHYVRDAKRILKKSPNMKIIGVTGSYGKTTTKFMITRLLSEKYTVTVTPESFNTPMGVVRTIREKMKPETEIFVVEMGAKKVGDIKEICKIVHPTYGVITSVGPQHLDTFHTMENIVKTKFELADFVTKEQGTMFLNYASKPVAEQTVQNSVCYGLDDSLDAYATDVVYHEGGASFTVCVGEQQIPLQTRLLGQHSILNLTVAVAMARHFDVPVKDIQFAVSTLKPTEHRLEVKGFVNGSLMIDDAYNANPEGCLEAVNVLGRFENKQKIIITPGLVELGDHEEQCNFDLGVRAGEICDRIVLVGLKRSEPIARGVRSTGFPEENLHIVASFKDAVATLCPMLDETCVVLVENDLPDNYLY